MSELCDYCKRQQESIEPLSVSGEEQSICEDCYGNLSYCTICKTHHHEDDLCRHIVWTDELEFCGCGYAEEKLDKHKPYVLAFLAKMGEEFAKSLLRSVEQHKYFLQLHGTIFGWQGLTCELLNEQGKLHDWDNCIELIEENEVALAWLLSLWSDTDTWKPETIEADALTASWCNEFLAKSNDPQKLKENEPC